MSNGAVAINDPSKRRKCPVCSQNIYLYHINFEEMFLMCENKFCEFPFGYEPIQIVHDESQLQENPVKAKKNFFQYPVIGANGAPEISMPLECMTGTSVGTNSSVSCSFLSDCDQLSHIGESVDISFDKDEQLALRLSKEGRKRKKREQTDKEIESNLKNIKELTDQIRHLNDHDLKYQVIQNKKWLKNLKALERQTGTKLLRDDENTALAKSERDLSMGEFKISVDPNAGDGLNPAVNIQILINSPKKEDSMFSLGTDNFNNNNN